VSVSVGTRSHYHSHTHTTPFATIPATHPPTHLPTCILRVCTLYPPHTHIHTTHRCLVLGLLCLARIHAAKNMTGAGVMTHCAAVHVFEALVFG
jgi:hypothetical protein